MEDIGERRVHNMCLCSLISLALGVCILMFIGVQTDPLMNFSIVCLILAVGALAGIMITRPPDSTKQIYAKLPQSVAYIQA